MKLSAFLFAYLYIFLYILIHTLNTLNITTMLDYKPTFDEVLATCLGMGTLYKGNPEKDVELYTELCKPLLEVYDLLNIVADKLYLRIPDETVLYVCNKYKKEKGDSPEDTMLTLKGMVQVRRSIVRAIDGVFSEKYGGDKHSKLFCNYATLAIVNSAGKEDSDFKTIIEAISKMPVVPREYIFRFLTGYIRLISKVDVTEDAKKLMPLQYEVTRQVLDKLFYPAFDDAVLNHDFSAEDLGKDSDMSSSLIQFGLALDILVKNTLMSDEIENIYNSAEVLETVIENADKFF